jgi:hypothetical protein
MSLAVSLDESPETVRPGGLNSQASVARPFAATTASQIGVGRAGRLGPFVLSLAGRRPHV